LRILEHGLEKYEVGDVVWIHGSRKEWYRAKVKLILTPEQTGYPYPHYVLEVETHVDDYLDLRNAFGMRRHNPDDRKLF
jgi:hypothetical protein